MCSGKLSHVPSQPAVVPSPRCMLSRDNSMPLDTWNLGHRETILAIHVQCSIHHGHRIKEFFTQRIKVPPVQSQRKKVQGDLSRKVKNKLGGTIPMPIFARRPSTMNSFFPAEGAYPKNYVADQQRLQISELQFDKFPTPSTFSCWKIRFKTQVSSWSSSHYFRVTGARDTEKDYADLFSVCPHDDNIQEFDSKWDGIFIIYDENPV